MNLRIPPLLPLLAATALVTGCAMEEADAGEAAYPAQQPPIGYTPPPRTPPANPSVASRLVPPPPPYGQEPAAEGQGGPGDVTDDGDVAIGADDNGAPNDQGGYDDTDPSALSDFHSTLEPYGTWTDDPTYGTVWVPSSSVVGQDFTPYVSAGHWAYDSDYAWVSDYDWGWAPFHYGRWAYAAGPGWEWIPGRAYAGAWVSWRYGVGDWGYVGWAPLPPTWCWRGGRAVGVGFVARAPYAFVGTGELFAPSVQSRLVGGAQVGIVASHTRPYVPASPSVGSGRVAAHPAVGGPPPSDLHIAPSVTAAATVNNRGLTEARAFSRPSSAMAIGARAPQGSHAVAMRSSQGAFSEGRTAAPVYRSSGAYASSSTASHFGGRFGGGFAGSAATAPPMRAPSYSYSLGGAGARPYYGSNVQRSAPASTFRSASPGGTFRTSPSMTLRSPSPSFSSGGFSSGAYRGGSSASIHSSSSGGFHGGGGGGFHGGGGGGHGGHR